ncbi:cytochrome c-type biogenesis protein [Phenylobacterium sp. J367]|uniref:cytochrome c-type biogenesis protein n=1 Tax=Phenylobacterium sp. J367 TaxID=2898435 RepID=UPI002150B2FC|nr:cytochrome c-type biogenesis protein [Phenylobacterium sp. J367]MCR5878869.1 cytochrome c-type biogenesis protein CcmH [Phenylobacterium sp. J367]
MRRLRALLAAAAAVLCVAAASDPAERLADPAQEARAREIFREVRCMVCQNESIDDSDAELAQDLRRLVREQVSAGRTEDQIKAYLTDRYGEFVLLTPAFNAGNLALWIGPFLIVLLGAGLLFVRLRNRTPELELSEGEAERLRRLAESETD